MTARAGEDYTATSGTLSFAPSQAEATVSVPVLGDRALEGAETFALAVSPPGGVALGTEGLVGTATIREDDADGAPVVSLDGSAVFDQKAVRFPVRLSEPSSSAVSVDYHTVLGSAGARTSTTR